jgi:hypothetical protein
MTNLQYLKILECVMSGISISIAIRRIVKSADEKKTLTPDQYRNLLVASMLVNHKNYIYPEIDLDLMEYLNQQVGIKRKKNK